MIATVGPMVKVKSPTAVVNVVVAAGAVTTLFCWTGDIVMVAVGAIITLGRTVNVAPLAWTVVEEVVGIATVWVPMTTLD
jgi:carbonic anhydrase/acetyltransferase-like protein (isoleucine patch superfamily)